MAIFRVKVDLPEGICLYVPMGFQSLKKYYWEDHERSGK
jgi:hypothetical protein